MRGISLYQPWAWLMQIGAKRIETRSWRWPATLLNQPTLICSTASSPKRALLVPPSLDEVVASLRSFDGSRLPQTRHVEHDDARFLQGTALGVGWPIVSLSTSMRREDLLFGIPDVRQPMPPHRPELDYGNYESGRFGTLFAGVRPLPQPFPIKGGQRVWNVTPADEARVIEQLGTLTPPEGAWVER